MRNLIATLALFAAAYFLSSHFCIAQTDGFSVARIHSDLSFNPNWEIDPIGIDQEEKLKRALCQKFRYLGCGGQCFAFVSEDEQYVIKFFKHRYRKPFTYFYQTQFPNPIEHLRKRKLEKALMKLNRDFTSYKIAYEQLPEETGLLYIHLNKTPVHFPLLKIEDKLGISHLIDLNRIEFVIQKKAVLAYEHIKALMIDRDLEGARGALRAIMQTLVHRCQKGIYDEDPPIHRNLGFVGAKPIFVDVGRFRLDESRKNKEVYQKDLTLITKRLRRWLDENYPPLTTILDEELDAIQNSD